MTARCHKFCCENYELVKKIKFDDLFVYTALKKRDKIYMNSSIKFLILKNKFHVFQILMKKTVLE